MNIAAVCVHVKSVIVYGHVLHSIFLYSFGFNMKTVLLVP